ncbi:MAG: DUF2284 domain-containing protein [Eubacteriales bacterium]|nr:DUF2284 domain-containing protein [Eubacteriales bacterium]
MDHVQQIAEKAKELGFHQSAVVLTADIPFTQEVRKMCEMNSCGMYGTNWQCPPGVGDVEACEKRARSFPHGVVVNTVWTLEDSFDFEGMQRGGQGHKQLFDQLKAYAVSLAGREHILPLGAGGCKLCEKCTYPDASCRHPDLVDASMEACGIQVMNLAGACGMNYINGKNTVTYFGVILLDD